MTRDGSTFARCAMRRMVAAYLGIKPKQQASKNYHDLLAMFPGGTIR